MTVARETTHEQCRLQGWVYQVTEVYADLLLAEVTYESEVITIPNGIKDRGVRTIVPRELEVRRTGLLSSATSTDS